MTKTILILAIAVAFVAGSITTGTITFADDDDDLSQLVCQAGTAMTGILFEDDDEITDILCGAQLQGPQGEQGPAGDDGADGATGPQGPAFLELYTNTNTVTLPRFSINNNDEVLCDTGDKATGGSFSFDEIPVSPNARISDQPIIDNSTGIDVPIGWKTTMTNPFPFPLDMTVHVICADITP